MFEKPSYDELLAKIADLEERVKRYRSFTENTSDLLYRTDTEGRITYLSKSVTQLSGYTMDEALGMNMANDVYLVPEEREIFLSMLRKDGKVSNFTARLKRKDGSIWWASTNAHFYLDQNGEIGGVEGITRDITELKLAEERLYAQTNKIKAFFNSLNDAVFVYPLRQEGVTPFVEVNNVAFDRYGYSHEEFLKLSARDITKKSDGDVRTLQDQQRRLLETGRLVFEAVHVKKSGEKFPVEINANIIYEDETPFILSVVRDVTERKRVETQLRKIDQLEGIATLSGGIAHEFNNALSVVSGNIELLQMALSDHENVRTFGRQVNRSIQRLKKLTSQLHAYARGGKYKAESLDLSQFVESNLSDIRSELHSDIIIIADLSENVSSISADPDQFQMVLSAILTNSEEALEGGGRILVRTYEEEVDVPFTADHPGITPGRYVALSVKDEGRGMDQVTKNRIFDPFFTTKFHGRGLGMAAVYGIVKNHHGYIYVDSELGKGTTVYIFVPPVKRAGTSL